MTNPLAVRSIARTHSIQGYTTNTYARSHTKDPMPALPWPGQEPDMKAIEKLGRRAFWCCLVLFGACDCGAIVVYFLLNMVCSLPLGLASER